MGWGGANDPIIDMDSLYVEILEGQVVDTKNEPDSPWLSGRENMPETGQRGRALRRLRSTNGSLGACWNLQ